MNATTGSNGYAIDSTTSHERAAAAIAPAHRFVIRLLGRAMYRYLKRRTVRDLRAVPACYRNDIGVPEHAIDEVAGALAARRADAWVRRRLGPGSGRLVV